MVSLSPHDALFMLFRDFRMVRLHLFEARRLLFMRVLHRPDFLFQVVRWSLLYPDYLLTFRFDLSDRSLVVFRDLLEFRWDLSPGPRVVFL